MRKLKKDLARDYGLTLSWRFAEVEFLGLPKLKDDRVHRLEHIYVPLRLCRDWKNRFNVEHTFHVPKILQEQRRLMVLGDPGSGKSTLVKVLTYAFGEARDNAYKRACGDLIPIPIILRTYNTRKWRNYHEMLRDFVASLDEDIREQITPYWLIEYLTTGKAILMIDGVDEVGSRADREHLRDQVILPLLRDAPESWIFVTSRVVGYDEVPFEFKIPGDEKHSIIEGGLECFYVAPFNDEEIQQFVTRWYALRELFPDRRQEGVDSLMRALNQNDRVKRLANNPQLLTLIALVHRVTANLPSGRVELYDKIVEAYLETIQVFRKLGTPARLDEMKRWLANVGWQMQARRDEIQTSADESTDSTLGEELLVTRAEIRKWLVEAIEKERGPEEAPAAAERFLDYVARRSGLLMPRGPDEFSFVHLTFQEYFAAFALRGRVRNFAQLAEDCIRLVEKRHWHETLNLLFEMLTEFPGACDDLFSAILNSSEENSGTAAEFISLLLPDEQSGLSSANQTRAAQFVLSDVCHDPNPAILKNLRQLGPESFRRWVNKPLLELLYKANPAAFPPHFFRVGNELVEGWKKQVCETITRCGDEPWSAEQVATMTLMCRDPQAVTWASERLSAPYWASPLNSIHETLAEDLTAILLSDPQPSARAIFLAQAGLISTLFSIQLFRINLIDPSFTKAQSSKLARLVQRQLKDSLFYSSERRGIDGPDTLTTRLNLIRWLILNTAALDASVVKFLLTTVLTWNTDIQFASVLSEDAGKRELDPLSKLGVSTLQVLDRPNKFSIDDAITLVHQAESAGDDWTQLIVNYYLIVLGEGTSERCLKMNQLLDLAIESPDRFTFPQQLTSLALSRRFTREELPSTMRLLFWHQPGDPALSPEWFDPRQRESKIFLARPWSLFKRIARAIDRRKANLL